MKRKLKLSKAVKDGMFVTIRGNKVVRALSGGKHKLIGVYQEARTIERYNFENDKLEFGTSPEQIIFRGFADVNTSS